MTDLLQSIDEMMATLNKAKQILEDESLEALLTYYEEGLYKEKSLVEVTNHVHQLVVKALNAILEPISCSVTFGEQLTDKEVVTFPFSSKRLGSIGELEVPEPILFIKAAAFGELLIEKSVDDLKEYTEDLVKLNELLQQYTIHIGFY